MLWTVCTVIAITVLNDPVCFLCSVTSSYFSPSYLLDDFGRIRSAFFTLNDFFPVGHMVKMPRETSFCDLGCIVILMSRKEQTPTHG